ncbi:NUDIX hydrolase [Streptacidiphilus sp. 4-A2]|nr:NUDIX hydrolase [Streptacidiphilus sp. 4-A2]
MGESGPPDAIAQPRAAAGVLFFDEVDRILLVKPTYKPGWEIPGGYIHPGETPSKGASREVKEEIGISPPIGRLLVADWAPHPTEGDKLLFVFDGGILPAHERHRSSWTEWRSVSTPSAPPTRSTPSSFLVWLGAF